MVAKNASKAAEGLCAWTKAMCSYQAASKIVKPKLEALKLAEAKLAEAQKELDKAEAKLQGVMDVLNKLQKQFEDQMAVKAEIEAPSRRPVLTPSTRLVSRNDGRGWSFFRVWGRSDRVRHRYDAGRREKN